MARLAQIVIPGIPYHIVQRGNRRQKTFWTAEDRKEYLKILGDEGKRHGLKVWAYCLMDNHVHIVAVPEGENSLARGIGETHRKYSRMIHFREGWRGYLWQGRFSSFPLDEQYLYAAVRYVERNPVRAGIAQ
jgi:putative transposase